MTNISENIKCSKLQAKHTTQQIHHPEKAEAKVYANKR